MLSFRRIFLLIAAVTSAVSAKSSTGDSVLVVVEPTRQNDYSIFFNGLKEKGYELTFRAPKEEKPVIIQDDAPSFAHVILFASETKNFAKDISPQSLVELLSLKTNLIIVLSTKQTPLSSLAAEFSIVLPPPGTPLVSYFPERSEPPSIIPIAPDSSSPILSKDIHPVWFSGVPMSLGNNPLLFPILRAPAESFAAEVDGGSADALVDSAEKGGEGLWAGSQLSVVTGFQALGGARVTWVGGVELFSDEYAKKEVSKGIESGNKKFASDIAAWTFQETLVLRIDRTEHHLVNATAPKEHYTTGDEVEFAAYISKFNPKTGKWDPCACRKDIQLDFTMLDPHVRTALPPVSGAPGKYGTTFHVPDRHGVFKFVIDYKRKGWTHLHSSTTIPVVPPRHDGYPRFLSAAWPYYAGAISTSVAFLLFSALWLAGDVREMKKGKGKSE